MTAAAAYICTTCGVQFEPTDGPPERCPVCADERQFVNETGQQWTMLDDLRRTHRTEARPEEPGLTGIGITPSFGIGQRALLVETSHGNVLWDCIPLLDDAAAAAVRERGGLAAIAASHPHFYGSIVEWSRAFGGVPVYLHGADRAWVMRPAEQIVFWEEETRALLPGLTLVRCGGHFSGSAVLHWAAGADDRGALLTGDTLQVVPDRRYVSFMRSYPNLIPLDAPAVRLVVAAVDGLAYDRIYGGWFGRVITADAKAAVRRSAERYLRAIGQR